MMITFRNMIGLRCTAHCSTRPVTLVVQQLVARQADAILLFAVQLWCSSTLHSHRRSPWLLHPSSRHLLAGRRRLPRGTMRPTLPSPRAGVRRTACILHFFVHVFISE